MAGEKQPTVVRALTANGPGAGCVPAVSHTGTFRPPRNSLVTMPFGPITSGVESADLVT